MRHRTTDTRPASSALRLGALAVAAAATGACTVGPDFGRPATDAPAQWSTPLRDSQPAQLAQWWNRFNDPLLSALIDRAVDGNLDLVIAEARIRQARAARGIVAGRLLPAVDLSASAAKSPDLATEDGAFYAENRLFNAGFDASWELDIFGRNRRGIEAADAEIEGAVADRRDVLVTLTAEIASTYAALRANQRLLKTTEDNLSAQQETLELTQKLADAGLVTGLDVAGATSQVESTKARIPAFRAAAREAIYALALLLGETPASLVDVLAPDAPIPSPPAEIPAGLPSDLLARRADVRRAEAELHAATAEVGVAVADQFPRVQLTAGIGTQASNSSDFADLANNYWSAGAGVVLPILDGGRIESNIELRRAASDAAIAAYRRQVLVAFKEVEVALVRFENERLRRESLAHAVDANRDAVELATKLYSAGRTQFLAVLTAQRALLDSMESLAESDRAVADGAIALYKTLGGGWQDD